MDRKAKPSRFRILIGGRRSAVTFVLAQATRRGFADGPYSLGHASCMTGSSESKFSVPFWPQNQAKWQIMKRILSMATLLGLASTAVPASAQAPLEGKWANPHHTIVVNVARCGEAYCGTISWANARNRAAGTAPGTRVLDDLRQTGEGTYEGSAFEPKRKIHGSAFVRQEGPNTMVVKGCAVLGLFCKEQRWTRVS